MIASRSRRTSANGTGRAGGEAGSWARTAPGSTADITG